MTADEQQLADIYNKVLNIARKEKAVSEGASFDLMYVNQQYHRQYMFLRKSKANLLLVVANFDDQVATVDVCIPRHAFEYLELREKRYAATDLLSGSTTSLELKADGTVPVIIPERGAVVFKLK